MGYFGLRMAIFSYLLAVVLSENFVALILLVYNSVKSEIVLNICDRQLHILVMFLQRLLKSKLFNLKLSFSSKNRWLYPKVFGN